MVKVKAEKNSIILTGVSSFNPNHVFECGQSFRWNKDEGGYTGIVGNRVIRVISKLDSLILENCTQEDFNEIWRYYFDFDRDYDSIKEQLSKDAILNEAIKYGWGIRILNQDPWETLISFIISANNNIGRIKSIIERLSRSFGFIVDFEGQEYYTFPEPEALASLDDQSFKHCGCGYRGPYIKETAQMVVEGEIDPLSLREMPYDKARQELLRCKGVGEKVADCISLFSLEKIQAFPVDVWIKRIMEEFYFHKKVPIKQIRTIAEDKFGSYAGLAQQYLFFYARDKKIGR